VYVAPAPVYVAPRGQHYNNGGYHRGGYSSGRWHNGRWIAPVAIAATIGGIAIATAPHYYNPPVTYVAPRYYNSGYTPTYYNPAPVYDAFSAADGNGDGYISYDEARSNGHWQRHFGRIDWNRDGYLSREEIGAFYR
jgi:EF hand